MENDKRKRLIQAEMQSFESNRAIRFELLRQLKLIEDDLERVEDDIVNNRNFLKS